MKKIFLVLFLSLILPLNAHSKIFQLEKCKMTTPKERDNLRDRIIKIDLKNKKLTFRGYAVYTNALQIKDELMVFQHDIIFTAFDKKLAQFKLKDETQDSKMKNTYTVDFEKSILQIKSFYKLRTGTESTLIIYTCENNNFDKTIKSNTDSKNENSRSILKKLLKK